MRQARLPGVKPRKCWLSGSQVSASEMLHPEPAPWPGPSPSRELCTVGRDATVKCQLGASVWPGRDLERAGVTAWDPEKLRVSPRRGPVSQKHFFGRGDG